MNSFGFVKDKKFEHWRWRIFGITWLSYASYYFTRKAFSVAKIGISEDPNFELTTAMMGNIDAVYLAAYAFGQFVWGLMADRYGTRKVMIGGFIMSIGAAMVMGLIPAATIFLLASGLQGLAQSTGWSSLCKNVSNFFSVKERGRVMGFWCTNYAMGGFVASPFAGWIAYEVFGGWKFAFFGTAAYLGVIFLLFLVLQRNKPQDVGLSSVAKYHNELVEKDDTTDGQGDDISPLAYLLQNKIVIYLGAVYFLLKPARYAILFWGPYMIYKMFDQTSGLLAATVPVAFEIAGVVGPIVAGFASDKLFNSRRIPVCVISLLLLTVSLAVFFPLAKLGGIYIATLGFFIIGLTLYGPDSMVSGTAAIDFGSAEGAGSATGFINGCGSIGAVFGGLLPGYVGDENYHLLFYGFAVINLIAALMLIPLWNKKGNGSEATA